MGSRVSTDFTNTMYVKQLCLAAYGLPALSYEVMAFILCTYGYRT